ncbi:hypothetical protein Vafri_12614 [Volvox africanus]|uniref:t-SNARE coiled-coil homology domain-containing protein n=1 Tax=Volvox africanus TaxID=51714 RepID=A0A8J4F1R0_9CHLO|nr:hypothetical protein Vafri_12614 [Volvox africanus]
MAVPRTAPGGPTLPEPNGSHLEVSFRRLLESCLEHLKALDASAVPVAQSGSVHATTTAAGAAVDGLHGDAAATCTSGAGVTSTSTGNDSDTAARVLKMRHYVDTLRELLADLRTQQDTLGLDAATLDLYDTHVKAIAAAVPKVQLPPYCQNLIAGTAVAPGVSGNSSSVRPAPNLTYFTLPAARPVSVSTAAGGRGERRADMTSLSSAASERLREAEAAQALLTDELADLTASLKANALGMAGAVAERGRLLDATDAALTDSLSAAKRNTAEAGRQIKRSGGNLCFTCMVLLLVGLLFTAMIVYIKFTHLFGYRASESLSGGGAGWLGRLPFGGGWGSGNTYGIRDDAVFGKGSGQSYEDSADPWQYRGEL